MSLILRQQCQPILDAAGFESYHVELKAHNVPYEGRIITMQVVGECGKHVATVKGVHFAPSFVRNQPL